VHALVPASLCHSPDRASKPAGYDTFFGWRPLLRSRPARRQRRRAGSGPRRRCSRVGGRLTPRSPLQSCDQAGERSSPDPGDSPACPRDPGPVTVPDARNADLAAAERLRALLLERGPRLARRPGAADAGAADAGAAGDRDGGQHRMHVARQVRQQAGELGERGRRGQLVLGRLVPIVNDQDEAAARAGDLR
jgi:hypothetical protein